MKSSDQVSRLLALVPYLLAHPDADLAETAARFQVTPRRLIGDLNVLWYCGLPGGLPDGLIEVDMDALEEGHIRIGNADFLARPMRFTLDEALSLVLGLRALLAVGDTALASAARGALAKLDAAVGPAAAGMPVRLASGDERVRDAVTAAIEAGVALRLTYDGVARGTTTTPLVDPVRVLARDGVAYLDAWDRDKAAWRTYRLDRIADAAASDQRAGSHGVPPERPGGWLDASPDAVEVTLDVASGSAWIAEYYPTLATEPLDDGGLRVRLLVGDPAWLRRLLLRLGGDVLAVEPAAAASSAADAAVEALAGYDETVR